MAINEIYKYPTVKQVIFQIRFPNLFYIESKIGDIQLKLMSDFPKSSILTRRQLIIANYNSDEKPQEIDKMREGDEIKKIWQFKDNNETTVHILSDSIDISSTYHKTYNNPSSDYKFRDIISKVIDSFIQIVKIPILQRIGLRYIDICPIGEKSNSSIKKFYNSVFPYSRFDASNVQEMKFSTIIQKSDNFLRYSENLQQENNKYNLHLDFDGYAINIKTEEYLNVLDSLHLMVSDEFQKTIKPPIIKYMKTGEIK